ncbi:MAG: hypothetical protein IT430_14125 [Phycisphaerales bacterium]|nr:hypothetical protein [Phycisphaerales bacterium]
MPRIARPTFGGHACHVLHRGVDRMGTFAGDGGYHFLLVKRMVAALGLKHTFRPHGRPRKAAAA